MLVLVLWWCGFRLETSGNCIMKILVFKLEQRRDNKHISFSSTSCVWAWRPATHANISTSPPVDFHFHCLCKQKSKHDTHYFTHLFPSFHPSYLQYWTHLHAVRSDYVRIHVFLFFQVPGFSLSFLVQQRPGPGLRTDKLLQLHWIPPQPPYDTAESLGGFGFILRLVENVVAILFPLFVFTLAFLNWYLTSCLIVQEVCFCSFIPSFLSLLFTSDFHSTSIYLASCQAV